MEDESLKRNTDCVYFLASPFTCKKGMECEYRHSEMARLNPRDCWYWLSGNCLNPACAFRHPPLESRKDAAADAAPSQLSQSSMSATKNTVPCYYYYNGFCKKGDRCPFLHEPGETFGTKLKMAGAPVLLLDKLTSGRAVTKPAPTENYLISSEVAMTNGTGLQNAQKQEAQCSVTPILKPSISKQTDIPECKETVAKTVSLQPAECSAKSECELSLDSDQSFEELIDGNFVRDEWWESSPGFDVLVEGKAEDMVYENAPDYMRVLDGNDVDSEHLFMPHDYSHQADCDERVFFNNSLHEPSDYFEEELTTDRLEYSSRHIKDREARRDVARKRNILCVESPAGGRCDVDLREYLRKRRMADGYVETRDLRHVRDCRLERLHRLDSVQRSCRRIESKVERNGVKLSGRRILAADAEQQGRPRNSQHHGYSKYNGMLTFSEQKSYSKREQYGLEFMSFHEDKEKRSPVHVNKNGSMDFEGPKPLSEILKDKKKTAACADGFLSNSS